MAQLQRHQTLVSTEKKRVQISLEKCDKRKKRRKENNNKASTVTIGRLRLQRTHNKINDSVVLDVFSGRT